MSTIVTREVGGTAVNRLLTNAEIDNNFINLNDGKQEALSKDASNGYSGLTLFKINFRNALNTFTNYFTNATTASRTYTFPDKDITVAGLSDITTYTHPANHPASIITQDATNRFVTDTEKTAWNAKQAAITMGANVATFLGTPSSTNLIAAVADETGSGRLVFNVAPTITGLRETRVALVANEIDLTAGTFFTRTITATTAFTLINIPVTGTLTSFVIELTNGGAATVLWWSAIKWPGGSAPALTAVGRDVLGFYTHDAGATWTGVFFGRDVK